MSKPCKVKDCKHPALAMDLCSKHYTQDRRKRLGVTKEIAPPGEGGEFTFRLNVKDKAALAKLAKAKAVTVSDLLREAVDDLLAAYNMQVPK